MKFILGKITKFCHRNNQWWPPCIFPIGPPFFHMHSYHPSFFSHFRTKSLKFLSIRLKRHHGFYSCTIVELFVKYVGYKVQTISNIWSIVLFLSCFPSWVLMLVDYQGDFVGNSKLKMKPQKKNASSTQGSKNRMTLQISLYWVWFCSKIVHDVVAMASCNIS
jgi:hypothetical protein